MVHLRKSPKRGVPQIEAASSIVELGFHPLGYADPNEGQASENDEVHEVGEVVPKLGRPSPNHEADVNQA
jgi:hypothetical protein